MILDGSVCVDDLVTSGVAVSQGSDVVDGSGRSSKRFE